MKTVLSILLVINFTFGLDTLINKELNFSIVFPKSPTKVVKENSDKYGSWINTNYTAYESNTKRTTSLIVKDYTEYDQTGISGEAVVAVTANMLLKQLQTNEPFALNLTKGEFQKGYSWSTDKEQRRLYIYWAKSILYILIIDEPHTVSDSYLEEFHGSFTILK